MERKFIILIIFSIFYLNIENLFAQDTKAELVNASKYFQKAKTFESAGQIDSAITNYINAGEIYNRLSSWENLVKTQIKFCELKLNKGEYQNTLPILQNAITGCIQNLGDKNKYLIFLYTLIGNDLFKLSEFDKSLSYYNQALSLRKSFEGEKSINIANLYNSIGNVYSRKGDFSNALDFYKKDLDLRKEISGETPELATSYTNIATVYQSLGDFDKAIEFNNNAFNLISKTGNEKHPLVAQVYFNLGSIFNDKGEYEQALQYVSKSLSIRKEIFGTNNIEVAQTFLLIGLIYKQKKDFLKSLDYYVSALDIQKEILGEKSADVAETYINLASGYYNQGNFDKALDYYSNAFDIQKAVFGENHPGLAAIYNNLGNIYFSQKKYDEAIENLDKAIQIYTNIFGKRSPNLILSYLELGNVYYEKKDFVQALENFHKSVLANIKDFNAELTNYFASPVIVNYYDGQLLLNSLSGKAKAFLQKYIKDSTLSDLELAFFTYNLCDTLISRTRQAKQLKQDKIAMSERNFKIYNDAINTCKQLNDYYRNKEQNKEKAYNYLKSAFYFSEKSKAGTLLDAISGSQARKFGGIPDSLIYKEIYLKDQIAYYEKQVSQLPEESTEVKFRNKLFELNNQYKELINTYEKDYPNYYEMKYNPKTAGIEDLQKIIDDSTNILSYFWGDKNLFVFRIDKKEISMFSFETDNNLDSSVHRFAELLGYPKASELTAFKNYSYELFKILIPKLSSKVKNLIIIPDGELGNIPYEALTTSEYSGDLKSYKDYPFLIKKYNIAYSYSANLFYLLFGSSHTESIRPSREWFGLAPVFENNTNMFYGGKLISAIQGTRSEITSIYDLFAAKGLIANKEIDNNATETKMKAFGVKEYKMIHIATHGFVNESNTELSGIVLLPDSLAGNDGYLYSGEIYGLAFKADLITLSACETGRGKMTKGEGIIGLSQAFIFAGTKNLIVSLWKVYDASTVELMKLFYGNILNSPKYNSNKMSSFIFPLSEAKRTLLNGGKYSHPYFWSPFILIGK